MSFVVPCFKRPDFERYATSKSQAQMFLNGGLLTDTLRDLYDLIVNKDAIQPELFGLVMAVVCICLTLEMIGVTFAIILMINTYPSKPINRPDSNGATLNTVEGGTPTEMQPYTGSSNQDPGDEKFTELVGKTPIYLKSINDGLTVISLLLVILYTVKSAFYPDKSRFLYTTTQAP